MVTIKRGKHVLKVTFGAFTSLYKPMGYVLEEAEEAREGLQASDMGNVPPDSKDSSEDNYTSNEDDVNTEGEEDLDEEEDEDELDEKPISEMNFNELKAYAKRLDLDVNGVSSKKELRKLISEAISD